MVNVTKTASLAGRIESLDQFRGYTVAGMFLVNFIGSYAVIGASLPILQHHNTHCSYADTIMPQFFFAVGFAFRLTFGRRKQEQGQLAANLRVIRRLAGLILVGLVLYTADDLPNRWNQLWRDGFWATIRVPLKREWFQTLVHIAVTSLYILPVISASQATRVGYMFFSAGLHVVLSHVFYFHWLHAEPSGIDGGPLGFLTWQIPVIMGTLACDWMKEYDGARTFRTMLTWSAGLMLLGYGLSCLTRLYDVPPGSAPMTVNAESPVWPTAVHLEGRTWRDFLAEPPFVAPPPPSERQRNYWMMSQKAGSTSYQFFGAGFSLLVYAAFVVISDLARIRLGVFRTLGTNALAAYILGGMVERAVKPFFPSDSPTLALAFLGFGVFFAIAYLFLRHLEKNAIFLRM